MPQSMSQESYQVKDDESTMNSQLEEITMNIQYPIPMSFKFSQEPSTNFQQLNEDTQMDGEATFLEDKSEYTFGKKKTTKQLFSQYESEDTAT